VISCIYLSYRPASCFSSILVYSWLAVLEDLSSDSAKVYWFLLLIILSLSLDIWLSQVLSGLGDSVWSLPPVFLGFHQSPGGSEALIAADLLVDLQTIALTEADLLRAL
jgi:glucose-6-phosphate-specific signal transduction histidine kinase